MASNNELVPLPSSSNPKVRINIADPKPIKLFIPDDDESVPSVFAQGRQRISSSGSQACLLEGYFSSLCGVLPDLTATAKRVLKNIGYRVDEISVPSQARRIGYAIPDPSQDLMLEYLMLAQMCFLPFQTRFDDVIDRFWCEVATNAEVELQGPKPLICGGDKMRKINRALFVSGLKEEVGSTIASSQRALAKASPPLGLVLSEAAKLNQKYSLYRF